MKNLFKIHPITYFILISVLLCGYFNYFLIISIILLFHDLGHIMFLLIFKYQISNILILPFGSIINSNVNTNSKTMEIFLISIAGVLMQIILYPIMDLLSYSLINQISYHIFLEFNLILILFNLLPIIPLDGSKIMLSFLELFTSYKKALKILNIISFISLILFLIYISYYSLNSYLILVFLAYKTYEEMVNHKYIFNQFLISRYLSSNRFKKIKYIKAIKKIYKNKYNFINNENEDKVLGNYFRGNY